MSDNHRNIFKSEYSTKFSWKEQEKTPVFRNVDCFNIRTRDNEIDVYKVKPVFDLNEAESKLLVNKMVCDRLQSTSRIAYKNHSQNVVDESNNLTEKSVNNELIKSLNNLYNNPHTEQVLAPPPTSSRIYGYIRPRFLHQVLSVYQDTYGREGAKILLDTTKSVEKKN